MVGTDRQSIQTYALLDSGASAVRFMDFDFAHNHQLPTFPLSKPKTLEAFDGESVSSGKVTHVARATLNIAGHVEPDALFYLTRLAHNSVILGHAWTKIHDVQVRWKANTLTFDSPFCIRRCLQSGLPTTVPGVLGVQLDYGRERLPDPKVLPPQSTLPVRQIKLPNSRLATVEEVPDEDFLATYPVPVSGALLEEIPLSVPCPALPQSDQRASASPVSPARPVPAQSPVRLNIASIGAAPFVSIAKQRENSLFTVSLRDLDRVLDQNTSAPDPAKPDKNVDPATLLPPEYHEFLDVFSRRDSEVLPPHRPSDHHISLLPGKTPPYGPLYGMSRDENEALRVYLKENLNKGFIRASQSPAASPVLFVKKPGGGLRFCVDYRGLNAITVKSRYPLPLITETLNRLSKAVVYTKLDIIAAFNRLRITEGEEWMTAFRTRYGLYESLVLPFGLCNGPSSFQQYINDSLREYLDVFCTAYLDDILIYSNSLADHRGHVRSVLKRLRAAGLQVDITKCAFHTTEVLYLGLVITTKGIRMDPAKIATIQQWPELQNVHDVRCFLGFANFYRRFIRGFSKLAAPLTKLTKKGVPFNFDPKVKAAFDKLRSLFTSDLILAHYDPDRRTVVETDASDFVSGGVLSQYDDQGVLRPVAFFSQKHTPAECNYEIYDKELMAIVRAFEQWRPELEGSAEVIKVITDHKNLEWFMTTKQLSRRQARWSEYLSRFNFEIQYRPGKQGEKPDSLTRRTGDLPRKDSDERLRYQNQVVLKPHNLAPEIRLRPIVETRTPTPSFDSDEPSLDELWEAGLAVDTFETEILTLLRRGVRHSRKIPLAECSERNEHLYFRDRRYVPDSDALKARLIRECHDTPAAGHPGRGKTYQLVSRVFWWPNMFRTVKRYVRNCHSCFRAKSQPHAYQGWLKPLPVPERRWQRISMDYVGPLPPSTYMGVTYRHILVVVDRLTKMRHLEPCVTMEAREAAEIYYRSVWKLHGLPEDITSDRGTQFTSQFWDRLCERLGIKACLSTSHHPETDGQTENANKVMEQYLRHFVEYLQDDWAKWLPGAEFAANNVESVSTSCSPFLANSGQHPRMGFEPVTTLPPGTTPTARIQAADADAFVNKMKNLTEHLKDEMTIAQAEQEAYANQNRIPPPAFQVGDKVFLNAADINRARPSVKLDDKQVGPYRVSRVLSPLVCVLDLPTSMRIFPVFHSKLLTLAPSDPMPGQHRQPRPPVVANDGEEEWFVDAILDSRINRRRRNLLEYLVQWEDGQTPTWEPWFMITGADAALDAYHAQYPRRPGPHMDRKRASQERST